MIDFTLTDEQQMLIEMTHDFVEKEMLPHEETLERTDTLPPKLATSLKERTEEDVKTSSTSSCKKTITSIKN